MGFLSMILGSKDTLDKADNIINRTMDGIDHVFYTDQEKAEAHREGYKANIEYAKTQRDENSVRSVARRFIAIMVVGNFLALLNASVIMWKFDKEYARYIFDVALVLSTAVTMVLGFYFGYYAIKSIIKSARGK